jgi:hypothetical protein
MLRLKILFLLLCTQTMLKAQLQPVIYWLQNTTGMGTYYTSGNYTAVSNSILYNCQLVQYNTTDVYVTTKGIPAYPTGPFLDGNPSQASNQNAIFKIPRNPVQNTGTLTTTTAGNIGIFRNGVALFDYRDGVSWRSSTNSEAGGPIGGMGDNVWNRDAIVAERNGFDCAKGHPAMGNYHHHQNPTVFDTDISVISTICNLYDSDGLYTINSAAHSPLLGFAYDGFPIYGAYGYLNTNGTGGIVRMKSSYQLRNITVRTHYANGTNVTDGPAVSSTYPLGRYREDYEYVAHPSNPDYLDDHNGRFCITPEYPSGTYAYFCTVDANHNSAYPYVVGPTFYGTKVVAKVTSVPAGTTTYSAPLPVELTDFQGFDRDGYAELIWSTASESGSSHFEIERSQDGTKFSRIGSVQSKGDTDQAESYQFKDDLPIKGATYYRLKQVDLDGQISYSKTISLGTNRTQDYKAFFSESSNLIVIQNNDLNEFDTPIELYDICGKLKSTTQMNQGSSISFIDTQTFYDGSYFVVIKEANKNTTFKIEVHH